MPVLYSGIMQEHLSVRNAAGIFDVSHMGQIFAEGPNALSFLQKIATNDISKCKMGSGIYAHMCKENGGIIDDIFVYCLTLNRFLIVVNASTIDKDFAWMVQHRQNGAELRNVSDQFGMTAVQGPLSEKVTAKLFTQIPQHHQCLEQKFLDQTVYLCRTGYTGEDGFEIIAPNSVMPQLWESCLDAGKEFKMLPCGLGARDTLRLECGYLLYGNDADEDHTSMESGPSWVIKFSKDDFIGKQALLAQKNNGVKRRLMGFKLKERGIPRHGSKILLDGREVGVVTSGTFSPSLQYGIAMGYVPMDIPGSSLSIECHSKPVPAEIVPLPFYKHR